MWIIVRRWMEDVNRDLTEFDGENCGDLGVGGWMMCTWILWNLKAISVETWL